MTTRTIPAAWSVLERAMETDTPVECRVTHVVPSGLQVQIEDLIAFFPQSQLELGDAFALDSYLGLTLRCHVLRMQSSRMSIVVGREKLLREAKLLRQDAAIRRMQPDTVVPGTVKKLQPYGAFVDLDGIDGLIKNQHLSWAKCKHPSEHVELGQHVMVKILAINCLDRKIDLSLREARSDPWIAVGAWTPGKHLKGTVVSVVDYGYFVRLMDGVDGLLHINNMATPKPALALHSPIDVQLLSIEVDKKRISLSIAQ